MNKLAHFSFRELISQRAIAARGRRRRADATACDRLIEAIDAELERRRTRVWARRNKDAPHIEGFTR